MNNRQNDSVNQKLCTCYENRLEELHEQIEACIRDCPWERHKVSNIFTMCVDEAYLKASPKIMFVGRETFGWFLPNHAQYNACYSARELMNFYAQVKDHHHNSPFWWFREHFSTAMGIKENYMQATLWTNLCKIDVDRKKPTGAETFGQLSQLFISLLIEEIAITKPDIVLIMTTDGHYNWHLNNYNWADNSCYDPNNPKPGSLFRQVVLPGKVEQLFAEGRLPNHTYQIRHPNRLRYDKNGYKTQENEVIEALLQELFKPGY